MTHLFKKIALFAVFIAAPFSNANTQTETTNVSPGATEDSALESEQIERKADEEKRAKLVKDTLISSDKEQNFALYKLNYAIMNDQDLMLQYSFKYRVMGELYLAYTNLVLWDIYGAETPQIDNNFMPEAFYRFLLDNKYVASVDAGWYHQSNGIEGPESRAWDRWQIRANGEIPNNSMQILWNFAVFSDIKLSKNNADIGEYRGDWEFNITARNLIDYRGNQVDVGFKLVPGEHALSFDKGQRVLAAHYRLPFKAFKPTIFAQYFHGYGQTIRFYNKKQESFRLGLSFHY